MPANVTVITVLIAAAIIFAEVGPFLPSAAIRSSLGSFNPAFVEVNDF